MDNNGMQPLHERIRLARRRLGLTQSELARETGCTQPGISMFESGRADALSAKTIQRLAQRLHLEGPTTNDEPGPAEGTALTKLKYCPVDDCPSNIPYRVRGQVHFKPTLVQAPTDQVTRCALCGEVLEYGCPNPDCNAPPVEGGFCYRCGQAYVTTTPAMRGPLDQWIRLRRDEIRELWKMSRIRQRGA